MPVSIREVADRAGVSRGTVSSVLNEKKEARIAVRTQERVRAVANEMGYRPNHIARCLGMRRTDTIGLMIGDLRNPFFIDILETAEDAAFHAGYDVMLDNAHSMRDFTGRSARIHQWPVDGILMWCMPEERVEDYLGDASSLIPVVYMGYMRDDDTDFVALDVYGGARMAMAHLIERGHRQIAFLRPGAGVASESEARHKAYLDVCKSVGITPRVYALETPSSIGGGRIGQIGRREAALAAGSQFARMEKASRPTAVICHNDVVAIGLVNGLRRAGMRVPDDVAVIGFDGIAEGRCMDTPLTTVSFPVQPLCEKSLTILKGRLSARAASEEIIRQHIVISTELLIGATS